MGDFLDPFWGQTREQAEETLRRIELSPPASDQPPQPSTEASNSGPLSIVDGQLHWLGRPIQSRKDPVKDEPSPKPETVHGSRRRYRLPLRRALGGWAAVANLIAALVDIG